jgi:uncharacterized SAM-binding protein YcdF (DUF218 family)
MGVPVVATDLFEIRRFNNEHGDLVRVASLVDDYVAAIRASLEQSPAAAIARRIEVARSNSWDRRLEAMSALIDRASSERAASTAGWERRLRSIYTMARRRALQIIAPIAIALLLTFYTPLAWWIAEPLRQSSPPHPADAIVVFAGGVGESGTAGVGVPERVGKAVELYRAGYAPAILFSSGYVFTLREAESMRAIAIANGVPAEAIFLEEAAANTYENVRNSSRIAQARGWSRVLLVSSPYHMLRATRTWHKVAPGIAVTPTPPAQSQFYFHTRGASLDQIRGIAHEYAAIFVYWLRGWV